MTTSDPSKLFVWIWLADHTEPVVAGVLEPQGKLLTFNYGKSYLARPDAEPIFADELPLTPGRQQPQGQMLLAGAIRDSAPDSWGRRVILSRLYGSQAASMDPGAISELTYLRESGSDRIGRLDFQDSPSEYIPRQNDATLDELYNAAQLLDQNKTLSQGLADALQNGTAIGGARPKALLTDNEKKYIAKFSAIADHHPMVKYEYLAMRLAKACELNVAPVTITKSLGRDVLLIERFDRTPTTNGWARKGMVSALTALGLDEMEAPYASYTDFAQWLRAHSDEPKTDLKELFSRLVFNILCGNTDDHARNHAAFVGSDGIRLTPAYDICPQLRVGEESSQGMLIGGTQRLSQVVHCLEVAADFLLSTPEAKTIIDQQIATLSEQWQTIAEEAGMNESEMNSLWRRQLLNPFALYDYKPT